MVGGILWVGGSDEGKGMRGEGDGRAEGRWLDGAGLIDCVGVVTSDELWAG